MNGTTQRLCAWCGVLCSLLWLAGFWPIAHYFVPHSPLWTPDEVATFFRTDTVRIRIGLIIFALGSVLYLPWTAAIATQMKRIEGEHSPLTWTQFGLGSIFVWVFFLPVMIWFCCAFRPEETSPELLQRMNDMAWLTFLNPVWIVFFQGIAIGIVILQDKRSLPIFPRWFGFFNIWAMIIFLPGELIPLFKSGPFAWNGLFAWWIPLPVFVSWMISMTYFLLEAIKRQEREATGKEAAPIPDGST